MVVYPDSINLILKFSRCDNLLENYEESYMKRRNVVESEEIKVYNQQKCFIGTSLKIV